MKNLFYLFVFFVTVSAVVYSDYYSDNLTFCKTFEGADIFADDGEFLGKLSSNKYDIDSIGNQYGTFGSRYLDTIFNPYLSYGSKYLLSSPWNKYSLDGPLAIKDDEVLGRLTVNKYAPGYVNIFSVLQCFMTLSDSRLESYMDLFDVDENFTGVAEDSDVCGLNSVSNGDNTCRCSTGYEWEDKFDKTNFNCKLTKTNTVRTSDTCDVRCIHAVKLAEMGIITYRTNFDDYRINDFISRQELIGIALKLKGITNIDNSYTCKNIFLDISSTKPNSWVCRVAELSASNEIVSKENKYFYPEKNVSLSEAYAIIFNALDLDYRQSIVGYSNFYPGIQDWQKMIIIYGFEQGVISDFNIDPNKSAIRGDLFSSILYLINVKNGTALVF